MNKRKAKTKKHKHFIPAFSLVELSIVLLIIGFLVISVIATNNLITQARIVNGKALTESSGIKKMEGLVSWYEAMVDGVSIINPSNNSQIGVWKDLSGNKADLIQTNEDSKPTYVKSGVNRLPSIRFDGTNDYMVLNQEASSAIANNNYTIVILEQRSSNKSNNYFVGGTGSGNNSNLYLGYQDNNNIVHGQTGNNYSAYTDSYEPSTPILHIFTNGPDGKKYYQDGQLVADVEDSTPLESFDNATIGKHDDDYYEGDISEIIIFDHELNEDEIITVSDYINEKWKVTTLPGSEPSTDNNCSGFSVNGVSQTSVNSSGGNLTCDQTGYTGTVSYTCVLGEFSAGTCSCASGYLTIGGVCVEGCETSAVTGVTSVPDVVEAGSDSFACDATGYTGSAGYTCSGGTFEQTSNCGCDTYYTWSGGICGLRCLMNVETGINAGTYVNHGSTSQACASGFTGSVTYTCNNGSYSRTGGGCTPQSCSISATGITTYVASNGQSGSITCNSGYSGSISYNCVNGNGNQSGSCTPQCWVSATGITGQYVNNGQSGSITCNSGYSGSISYNCSGGNPNQSGSCTLQCWLSATGIGSLYVNPGTNQYKACNYTGFNTSDGFYYNCSSGTANITSGACDSCASGFTWNGSTCNRSYCTFGEVNSISGINNYATIQYNGGAWSNVSCNATGYSGTISVACNINGYISNSGSCTQTHCINGTHGSINGVASGAQFLNNGTWYNTNCSGTYKGTVQVRCLNGSLSQTGTCTPFTSCSTHVRLGGFQIEANNPNSIGTAPGACIYNGQCSYFQVGHDSNNPCYSTSALGWCNAAWQWWYNCPCSGSGVGTCWQ